MHLLVAASSNQGQALPGNYSKSGFIENEGVEIEEAD
jgi:hypothetical protein